VVLSVKDDSRGGGDLVCGKVSSLRLGVEPGALVRPSGTPPFVRDTPLVELAYGRALLKVVYIIVSHECDIFV
jgi:hypothetical protein